MTSSSNGSRLHSSQTTSLIAESSSTSSTTATFSSGPVAPTVSRDSDPFPPPSTTVARSLGIFPEFPATNVDPTTASTTDSFSISPALEASVSCSSYRHHGERCFPVTRAPRSSAKTDPTASSIYASDSESSVAMESEASTSSSSSASLDSSTSPSSTRSGGTSLNTSADSSGSSSSLDSKEIAGISVSAVAGTAMLAACIFLLLRRWRFTTAAVGGKKHLRDSTSTASTASTAAEFRANAIPASRPDFRRTITTESSWIDYAEQGDSNLSISSQAHHQTGADDHLADSQGSSSDALHLRAGSAAHHPPLPSPMSASTELAPWTIGGGLTSDQGHSSDSGHNTTGQLTRGGTMNDPFRKHVSRTLSVRNPDFGDGPGQMPAAFGSGPSGMAADDDYRSSVSTSLSRSSSRDPSIRHSLPLPALRFQGGDAEAQAVSTGTPQEVQHVLFGGQAVRRTSYFE